MSDEPPPKYAAYPRGQLTSGYGSSERLQSLADGYFGLNYVFFANMLLAVLSRFAFIAGPRIAIAFIAVVFLSIAAATYPFNKKIAFGKNWPNAYAGLASFLMGLNSALCCGIIGYIVMQQIASSEIMRYGVKRGWLGLKKKDIAVVIDRLHQLETGVPMAPTQLGSPT